MSRLWKNYNGSRKIILIISLEDSITKNIKKINRRKQDIVSFRGFR